MQYAIRHASGKKYLYCNVSSGTFFLEKTINLFNSKREVMKVFRSLGVNSNRKYEVVRVDFVPVVIK